MKEDTMLPADAGIGSNDPAALERAKRKRDQADSQKSESTQSKPNAYWQSPAKGGIPIGADASKFKKKFSGA